MVDRTTKLRWRQRIRRSRRQVEGFGQGAEFQLERNVMKRLGSLDGIVRFLLAWVLLLVLLCGGVLAQARALSQHYQTLKPIAGGTYTEGILGAFTNANPLYATGNVDSAISRLVFSGLYTFNDKNQLVGDLAEKISADSIGTTYTVTLKPNLMWHDGHSLTSADVVFTYNVIQNADAKSPLASSWQGIKITALNPRTVVFKLPNALSAFPYSLTNGIVPRHKLEGIPTSQLRSINFNTVNPVGSGPFKWSALEVSGTTPEDREQRIGLVANDNYHRGKPKLARFVIHSYQNEKRMIKGFTDRELNAITGVERLPDALKNQKDVEEQNQSLTSQVMVFFKTNHEALKDPAVRRALVLASNPSEILSKFDYPLTAINQPLLKSQLGYNEAFAQQKNNPVEAAKMLDQAGWKPGADGIRAKNGLPLSFRLYSESTSEYATISQALQKQWKAVGADAQVLLQPGVDLQSAIAAHNYDALLYGISLGIDPDVFPYWHSSQADVRSPNRLNLSEYKNSVVDRALEAGRTRTDPSLRALKYKPFLEAWRNDAPALTLYQPRALYITHGEVFGFKPHTINVATDRYSNVENWMVRQAKANK